MNQDTPLVTLRSATREPELPGQTVVVIGGSSGIGLETARRARAEGAAVVLTGRNPERLQPGLLVIHSIYNGYWFWGRPSFEDLRRDLREVTREIRPDWDLAAPGLRENWEAGDHSMHHPYLADHGRTPSAADSPSAAAVPGGA